MSNKFYDFPEMIKSSQKMYQLIEQCYKKSQSLPVLPPVKPGFLRNQLPQNPPSQGKTMQQILQTTKTTIFDGTMNWQSPKYFGYFISSVNTTNPIAQIFATSFHTPGFGFATSPSHTQLENIVMDWSAKAIGLPEQKFLLKGSGGGVINNSTTESIFNSVNAAKHAKCKQLGIELNNPDILKLVGYFGQGSHMSSERGLFIKDIFHRKAVPYHFCKENQNYEVDPKEFEQMVNKDIENGLIPFVYLASYGTTFSGSIDINEKIVEICKKHKLWINLDAAFLGSAWICPKYRPSAQLLDNVDSICINFSKLLLSGTGGSLLFVADKDKYTSSFKLNSSQFYLKNQYTGVNDIVDYRDWIVGFGRRNNAIKLYYTFQYYGTKVLEQAVKSLEVKTQILVKMITSQKELFEIFSIRFCLVLFQVKSKLTGKPSNKLTKKVAEDIKNIKQGFCSPGEFKGEYVIRIVVGHFHTEEEHLNIYFKKILEKTQEVILEEKEE